MGGIFLKSAKIKYEAGILRDAFTKKKEQYNKGLGTYFKNYPGSDSRIFTASRFYRYISFVLTSLFYFAAEVNSPSHFKLLIIFLLYISAVVTLQGYKRYRDNVTAVGVLIFLETMIISLIMVYSGGFGSPFLWYVFNPIIIAAVYLPMYYTWLFLCIFFFWFILVEYILLPGMQSFWIALTSRADLILIMLLLTLIVQIFARLYNIFKEQSQRLQMQQEELTAAFQSLLQNNQLFQALSNYQRDIVSYQNEEDIYLRLLKVSEEVFPFSMTAVLLLEEPSPPDLLTPGQKTRVIMIDDSGGYDPLALEELKDLWKDFSWQAYLTANDKRWIALPIWSVKKQMMAVFIGWLKDGENFNDLTGTLPLFIYFTEQVIRGIKNLKQVELYLKHISSLYEAVETISDRNDPKEVIDLFAAYAKALTGCDKVIFWMEQLNGEQDAKEFNSIYTVRGKKSIFPEEQWQAHLLQAWSEIRDHPRLIVDDVEDCFRGGAGKLICVPVKSRARCFGILAALQSHGLHNLDSNIQILSFLAELSAVSIERNISEMFTDKLLVIEEQNRIANEIHDSISQNLFSIVYGLDALVRKTGHLPQEYSQTLYTIRDVASQTAKELRLLIYRLSPRHRGDDTFVKEVRSYLDGLAKLNKIDIHFNITGKEEYLNPAIRRAFYRIIKESTGNAVRHGECSSISVELEMNPFNSKLTVSDNGKGFEISRYAGTNETNGKLGLVNMKELAYSLQGIISIDSKVGEGTVITCSVPTSPVPHDTVLSN